MAEGPSDPDNHHSCAAGSAAEKASSVRNPKNLKVAVETQPASVLRPSVSLPVWRLFSRLQSRRAYRLEAPCSCRLFFFCFSRPARHRTRACLFSQRGHTVPPPTPPTPTRRTIGQHMGLDVCALNSQACHLHVINT